MTKTNNTIEEIYQAMDVFLTESTDINHKPVIRSINQLNEDRHLFVGRMETIISQVKKQAEEDTLKDLISECQRNELDGKGYDFYFNIRAKIDNFKNIK